MKRTKKSTNVLMLIMSLAIVCLSFGMFSFKFSKNSQALEEEVANAVSANGGAMYIGAGSTVTLSSDCTISGITGATQGGAIYVAGTLIIDGATISSCSAEYGGAIYIANGGQVTMNSGTIENCTASQGGGVFVASSGKFIFNDGDIFDCSASQGGGIYNNSGSSSMSGGSIRECYAESTVGGGIYNGSSFTLSGDAYIGDCSAELEGGGIYSSDAGTLMLTGSSVEIYSCSAGYRGGGIFKSGSHLLLASSGTIELCSANEGGGVYATSEVYITMQNTFTINECSANGNGGGLWMTESNLNMTGGSFVRCYTPGGKGGAIYSDFLGSVNITGGYFNDCHSYDQQQYSSGGGAIFSYSAETFKIQGTSSSKITFDGCYVEGQGCYGGAIYIGSEECSESVNTIEYAEFIDCWAEDSGGALAVELVPSGVTISSTSFSGCYTDVQDGGAIYCVDSSKITLNNGTTFNGCYAVGNGGAIACMNYLDLVINDATITNCSSDYDGGAIYLENTSSITMTTNSSLSITSCTAYVLGGGIFIEDGGSNNLTLYNATISSCTANEGGGIYISDGKTLTLNNGSLSGNTGTDEAGNIYVSMDAYLYINGTTIQNGVTTNGSGANIFAYGQNEIYLTSGSIQLTSTNASNSGDNIYFVDRVELYVSGGTIGVLTSVTGNNITGDGQDVYITYSGGYIYSTLNLDGGGVTLEAKPANKLTIGTVNMQIYALSTSYLSIDDYKSGVSGYVPTIDGKYVYLEEFDGFVVTVVYVIDLRAAILTVKCNGTSMSVGPSNALEYIVEAGSSLTLTINVTLPGYTTYVQTVTRYQCKGVTIMKGDTSVESGKYNYTSSAESYTYTVTATAETTITITSKLEDTAFLPSPNLMLPDNTGTNAKIDIYYDEKKYLQKLAVASNYSGDVWGKEKNELEANVNQY